MKAKERIALLRKEMEAENTAAFIVYSADPHMSEYLPDVWKERAWISGFTGSAGFVVITRKEAGLWTDGRYFTQADMELKDSGIQLMKMGEEGTPDYIDWIVSQTPVNGKVGVNALVTSHADWEKLKNKLEDNSREITNSPLLDKVWTARGEASQNPIFVHPVEWAGESVTSKLEKIRKEMKGRGAGVHILSALDDIAWTLNLRGSDVECNPVFLSYLIIREDSAVLFVDDSRMEDAAKTLMKEAGVEIKSYKSFFDYLSTLKNQTILIADNCNEAVFKTIEKNNLLKVAPVPAHLMKAIKNKTELEGFRTVMVRDGVAMVKFLHWLTHHVGKEAMNEYSIGEKLYDFRAAGKNFVGVSFSTIAGYKGNGAIIHYSAPEEGCAEVSADGSILVDSGGQYLEGTSDITRTIPLGEISDDFKRDYTLVLKGHIRLAMAKFPKGTRGSQLDILAREPLWDEGKDYNHGTGHGVGSFLNVHEGPANIRKEVNPQELIEGMVLSNEPGYYLVGKYGIRHENLIVVREWKKTQWNTFYDFETITLCPFFQSPILWELLSREEIEWLNHYHETVKEKLLPHLEGEVKEWFLKCVAPHQI